MKFRLDPHPPSCNSGTLPRQRERDTSAYCKYLQCGEAQNPSPAGGGGCLSCTKAGGGRVRKKCGKYLLCALLLIVSGCRPQPSAQMTKAILQGEAKDAKESLSQIKDVELNDWELTGNDDQRRPLWRVSAKRARIGEGEQLSPKRATLTSAKAQLFKDGKLESSFGAQTIEFLNTPQGLRLQMKGNVQATTNAAPATKSGDNAKVLARGPVTMTGTRVDVNVRARRVYAPQSVQMMQGKGKEAVTIKSKTLLADSGLGVANLGGGVTATTSNGSIQAKQAVWNWKTGRAQASGDVSATNGATTLTGQRLNADVRGARGQLAGAVIAKSADGTATAQTLDFNWNAHNLLARGDVILQKDGGTLRAARIESATDLSKAIASGEVRVAKDDLSGRADRVQGFDKMTRIVANGAVNLLVRGAKVSGARVEVFDVGGQPRVVGSGNVKVVRDNFTMSAPRVEAKNRGGENWSVQGSGGVNVVRSEPALNFRANTVLAQSNGGANWDVTGSGEVRASNAQGTVRAQTANWKNGRVVASGGVQLEKDGYNVSGARLTSDDRFQNATLSGDVKGRLPDGARVSAGTVNKNGNAIVARDGVNYKKDQVSMRAARLDTTLSGAQARLSGGVVLITSDGATVRAPELRYDKSADAVYGSGGAHYNDARGLKLSGRTLVINHVSDEKRRVANLKGTEGSGSQNVLEGLKIF